MKKSKLVILESLTGARFILKKSPYMWYVMSMTNKNWTWSSPNKNKLLNDLKTTFGIVPL